MSLPRMCLMAVLLFAACGKHDRENMPGAPHELAPGTLTCAQIGGTCGRCYKPEPNAPLVLGDPRGEEDCGNGATGMLCCMPCKPAAQPFDECCPLQGQGYRRSAACVDGVEACEPGFAPPAPGTHCPG